MKFHILFTVLFINGDGIKLKTGPYTIEENSAEINFPIIEKIIQAEMKKISRQGVYSTSDTHIGMKHYGPQQVYLITVDNVEYLPEVEDTDTQIENTN